MYRSMRLRIWRLVIVDVVDEGGKRYEARRCNRADGVGIGKGWIVKAEPLDVGLRIS